jgi:hypothetical protein
MLRQFEMKRIKTANADLRYRQAVEFRYAYVDTPLSTTKILKP